MCFSRVSTQITTWPEDSPAPRSWLLEQAAGASALCVMMSDRVDAELLSAAASADGSSSLRVVSTFSVGYDHIDVSLLRSRAIRIGHTPNVLNDAVADITVMLVLMASRRAGEAMQIAREGRWPRTPWSPFLLTGPALSSPGLTIGFLGFGRISHATLRRLLAFTSSSQQQAGGGDARPRCIYTSSRARPDQDAIDASYTRDYGIDVSRVDLSTLAAESDVLIVLCSLSDSTRHLVDAPFLARMKRSAVLVNTARGGIVDSQALAEALERGTIFGAGVDVVEGEPDVSADHPLLKQPRCVVLPHIGSASDASRLGMAELCAKNALAALRGEEMPAELQ